MSGRFLPWPSFQVDIEDMASDHRTQAQPATWWIPFLRGGKSPTPERKGPWQSRSVASRQTGRWSPGSSRCSRLASLLSPSRTRLTPSSRRSQRRSRRWPPIPLTRRSGASGPTGSNIRLNLNDFVLKDQVVMTPAFWGAEPAIADRGPYAGLREFDAEQRNRLELLRAR